MNRPAAQDNPTDRLYRHARPMMVYGLLLVALLGGDLWLKSWSFTHLPEQPIVAGQPREDGPWPLSEPRTIIEGVLELQLVENHGAVFGLGQGARWPLIGITVIAVIAVCGVMGFSDRRKWLLHGCMVFVLAGALGNLYDRMVFGVVRDMLHIFPGQELPWGLRWPSGQASVFPWVFNLADVWLNMGIWPLIARTLFTGSPPKAEAAPAATDDAA